MMHLGVMLYTYWTPLGLAVFSISRESIQNNNNPRTGQLLFAIGLTSSCMLHSLYQDLTSWLMEACLKLIHNIWDSLDSMQGA